VGSLSSEVMGVNHGTEDYPDMQSTYETEQLMEVHLADRPPTRFLLSLTKSSGILVQVSALSRAKALMTS